MAEEKDNNQSKYWAAIEMEGDSILPQNTRDAADAFLSRIEDYYNWTYSNGWMSLWYKQYTTYNANKYTGGTTLITGENGDMRTMYVNHFSSLLDHVKSISITERPAWKPIARNNDSKSQKQTIIAEKVLDDTMREKRVERHLSDATRNALLFCEGFVSVLWDPYIGESLANDGERDAKSGDLVVRAHEPVDVIRDPSLTRYYDRSWIVLRTYENKWDLAAKYPEYKEEIISQQMNLTNKNHYLTGSERIGSTMTDQIIVYNCYHSKSAACPDGRQMTLLVDGTALTDSILLYDKIPVHRIVQYDQIGSPMGKSVSIDLLPLQEMLDGHWTTVLSINENYGIANLMLPIGSNMQPDVAIGGFNIINYNAQTGIPKVMEMPTVPQSIGETLQMIVKEMEMISGVNAVSRGQPPASLESGSALALVQSMAIQFNSGLQQSYVGLLEDLGTAIIQILKNYADTDRMIQLVGEKNRGVMQTAFNKDDLDNIQRVTVDAGSAMSKTPAGKMSIAQDLLKNKIITTSREYLMVMETGQLDPLTQGPTLELLNLSSENEMLLNGEQVEVLFTDDHVTHIQEHKAMASDPMVRADAEKFAAIAAHLQKHMEFLMDPQYQMFNQLMGQPNMSAPMQQGGAPGPQGQPQPRGPQGMPPKGAPGMPNAGNPAGINAPNGATPGISAGIQTKAAGINPAQMPVNPMTKQRV